MTQLSPETLFIADAHYNPTNRPELLTFLRTTTAKEIVFMGDTFDLLIGNISLSVEQNREIIDLINHLCIEKSIIILEGNHDFRLKKLFKKTKVIPLVKQPLIVKFDGKITALAHGDNFGKPLYRFYTKLIRNKQILNVIDFVDTKFLGGAVFRKISNWVNHKLRCHPLSDFEQLAKKRIALYLPYGVEQIIEGHFHQGKSFTVDEIRYINLKSFGCERLS